MYIKNNPNELRKTVLVFLNHWLWFNHFSSLPITAANTRSFSSANSRHLRYSHNTNLPSFSEVASFFGICVWLAPFSLFISLSPGDYSLPTTQPTLSSSSTTTTAPINIGLSTSTDYHATVEDYDDDDDDATTGGVGRGAGTSGGGGGGKKRYKGMAKAVFDSVWGYVMDSAQVMGLVGRDRTRPF